jgi:hypothetical protein
VNSNTRVGFLVSSSFLQLEKEKITAKNIASAARLLFILRVFNAILKQYISE